MSETTTNTPDTSQSLAATLTRAANEFWADVHVNVSGLLFFALLGYGVFHPEAKSQCTELCTLAATYLFASSKAK